MDIYEYQKRLLEAVKAALEVIACDDCKARYLGAQMHVGGKAYVNAPCCESCAFRVAEPLERLVLERAHSLVGRHAELVAQAWRRLRAPDANVKELHRNWDVYVLAYDQGTGKDPQEIRGDRSKEYKEAWGALGKALDALDEALPKGGTPAPKDSQSAER